MNDADDLAERVEEVEANVEALERQLEDAVGGFEGRISELEERLGALGRPVRRGLRRRRTAQDSTDGE